MADNPFDALDDATPDTLEQGPEPGAFSRIATNVESSFRHNTLLGSLAWRAGMKMDEALHLGETVKHLYQRNERLYEAFPEWRSWTDGAAALTGQVAGTAASPESFIPLGLGEKIIVGTKAAATGIWAKVFGGAVDAAAVNAVTDASIQGIEISGGVREKFDPVQYSASILLGAGIGGGAPLAGAVAKKAASKLRPGEKVPAVPERNPFDAFDEGGAAPLADQADPSASKLPDQAADDAAAALPGDAAKPADQGGAKPVGKTETKTATAPAAEPLPIVHDTIGEKLSDLAADNRAVDRFPPSVDATPLTRADAERMISEAGHDLSRLPPDRMQDIVRTAGPETEAMTMTADRLRNAEAEIKRLKSLKATEEAGFDGSRQLESSAKDGTYMGIGSEKVTPERPHAAFTENERIAMIKDLQAEVRDLKTRVKDMKPREADVQSVSAARSSLAKEEKQVSDFFSIATGTSTTHAQGRVRLPQAMQPGQAVERIARVRETAEALAKSLEVHATRQGRISMAKALGVYNTKTGAVRMRSLDDFDTLTHEYGHHLDAHVPAVKGFIKKHSAVLKGLDYDPTKGRDYEGFAEFFRLWITNRPFVEAQFPAQAAEFDKLLKDKAPDMAKGIDAARDAWDAFLSAPSSVAVQSTIVSGQKKGWFASTSKALRESGFGGTISEVLQRIYGFAFDDLNPINRAVRYLEALHVTNKGRPLELAISSDPYKLARMSRGSYSAGHMDVMYGVADYRGINPASPSLRDAIIEAMGAPNALSKWNDGKAIEFGAYLWSRRALGEWERFRKGEIPNPPDKLTEADHVQNVKDMEAANPQFVSAAAKVHEFAHALWRKKRDAGLIDDETYLEGLKIKDYVPGLRDFSTSDTDLKVPAGPNRQGKTAKGGFARRFKGSKRDVINPLESLAADAYETSMAIARNDVVKALDRLARTAGVGGGAIAERIPAKEMRATMIDPLEAVENAAKNAGLARADIVVLRDALESAVGSEKAAIFRPAIINEKGEPIVFFRDGGQLAALRLADGKFGLDMYRALSAMSQHEKNFWLELVAVPARLLRMGITTALEFVGANFIRDQTMATIFYGRPFRRLGVSLQGAADDLLGREAARNYSRVYGISGGQETASLSKLMAERDLSALKRKGWVAQRLTSFRGILSIAEVSETATRMGLFRTFKREAQGRGLDEYEATFEAAWRARDYLDFDRRGSGMAALARVIPFLNVALQGLDKSARHMIAPLAKKMLGKPLTQEDQRAMGVAVKAWARLAMLVTGSVSLYALQSRNEDHDEISEYTRSTHWMIKAGDRWVAVPKPFEFATVINLAEASYDAMVQKDARAGTRWLDSLYLTLMPPSLLEGNPAIKSYFEIKTNTDFFTGAPIVPDQLKGMEPFLQYTARTSMLSRQMGEMFNTSPAITDHLITAHLGSWGRTGLSLYDMAQPDAPGFAWDDAPIARRFIKDAAKGSQSGTMFWDLVSTREGTLEGQAKSWKAMMEAGDAARAQDYYAGLDTISKAYVGLSTMDAATRRLHPLIRARGAVEAIGAMRRDLAANRLVDFAGQPIAVTPPERTAADDILSTLAMAMMRNALKETGVPGWSQRSEIDEEGYYRELQALSPALLDRLGTAYAEKNVWKASAVKAVWPELRDRILADGSDALTADLGARVKAEGPALIGIKPLKEEKPKLTPNEN